MRAQEAPQAAQRDAEVVQRLVAIAVDEPLARGFGRALELHQRQAAHGLLGRAAEQVGGELSSSANDRASQLAELRRLRCQRRRGVPGGEAAGKVEQAGAALAQLEERLRACR